MAELAGQPRGVWDSLFGAGEKPTLQQAIKKSRRMEDDLDAFLKQKATANDPWSALAHIATAGVKGYMANKAGRDAESQYAGLFEPDPETGKPNIFVADLPDAQRDFIRELDPETGLSLMAKRFMSDPKERYETVLDESGRVLGQRNTVTGKVEAHPQAADKTPWWVQDGGIDPRMAQYRSLGAARTSINMPKLEEEYDKSRGKFFADTANAYDESARKAAGVISTAQTLRSIFSDPAVYQGTGGDAVVALKRVGRTILGQNVDGLGPAELAQSVSTEMALDLKEKMGGGVLSDSDIALLRSMPASLSKTSEGNLLILDLTERRARRDQEVAQMARQYEQQYGRVDAGFYDQIQQWANENPLYTEDDWQAVRAAAAKAEQASPFSGTGAEPVQVQTPEDYNTLPSGAVYRTPDGKIKRKP